MKFINKHEENVKSNSNMHAGHRGRVKAEVNRNKLAETEDYKTLEFILYKPIPRKDTNETAHKLIKSFGSLANICDADVEDLKKIEGVSDAVASFLHMVPYILRNYQLSKQKPKAILTCTQDIYNYMGKAVSCLPDEEFYAICLDNGDHVINRKLIARGTDASVNFDINDVIRFALNVNAKKVVLVHNHPTTSETPSVEDVSSTQKLYFSLSLHNIQLTEHLIVNYMGNTYSFANSGYMQEWQERLKRIYRGDMV